MYLRAMVQVRKNFLWLWLIFIGVLSISCNEPDEVGLGVQPTGDQPGVITRDIDGLTTYTEKEDSLISSSKASPLFLGSINDNETGITAASFYAQVRLGSTVLANTFNGITTPDSVFLTLGYIKDGIYGDTNSVHHISVYQINQEMKDTLHYSTEDFSILKMLGHIDIIPKVNDSVNINGINKAPHLRIPLDTAVGGSFMRELINHNGEDFYKNYFQGIYVVDSSDGTGSIVSFAASSAFHRMVIYYHDTSSKTFELEINGNSVRSLRFKHEYCNSYGVSPQVCNPVFPTMNHDTVYVQSLAGLKTKIMLPDWNQVFNYKKVSINRADLILTIKDGTDGGLFKPHENLLLVASDSAGKEVLTIDFFELGGTYSSTDKQYKLNLTRHLQRILNGNVKDYGLYIIAGGSTSNARRTILNGGLSMKINITYTQQNN